MENINILYEDNHLIVVVKPQNLAACPDSSSELNMLDLVKTYIKKNENKVGEAYVGLVHRLDQPTGGIMIFAKTSKAASRLFNSIQENTFEKNYLAITSGVPKKTKDILKDALYKDTKKNKVYCVPIATEGAKLAILEYTLLSQKDTMALLKINLMTGRAHQIRVQLSNIGAPIYGDRKYGIEKINANLALWAYLLKFPHPTTKEIMVFIVYPPQDEMPWTMFDISTHIGLIK